MKLPADPAAAAADARLSMAQRADNDPALIEPQPGSAAAATPGGVVLAAEVARIDAAVREAARALDFYAEPAHFAAALRRLA